MTLLAAAVRSLFVLLVVVVSMIAVVVPVVVSMALFVASFLGLFGIAIVSSRHFFSMKNRRVSGLVQRGQSL